MAGGYGLGDAEIYTHTTGSNKRTTVQPNKCAVSKQHTGPMSHPQDRIALAHFIHRPLVKVKILWPLACCYFCYLSVSLVMGAGELKAGVPGGKVVELKAQTRKMQIEEDPFLTYFCVIVGGFRGSGAL